MIKLIDVSVSYKDKKIFSKLNLRFNSNGFYAILGPNGAGKSTLLKTIIKYLNTDEGNIEINGKNLNSYTQKELAKQIAFIPQSFNLQFDYSVFEIVLMGRFPYQNSFGSYSKVDEEIAMQMLTKLDLKSQKDKNFNQLSGGEQQRVLIARALCQQTPIILLDEAFSHLDIHHQLDIMQLLTSINNEGKLIILISHNINLVSEFCKSAILLKNGKIVKSGTINQTLTQENINILFSSKIKVFSNPISNQPNISYIK